MVGVGGSLEDFNIFGKTSGWFDPIRDYNSAFYINSFQKNKIDVYKSSIFSQGLNVSRQRLHRFTNDTSTLILFLVSTINVGVNLMNLFI